MDLLLIPLRYLLICLKMVRMEFLGILHVVSGQFKMDAKLDKEQESIIQVLMLLWLMLFQQLILLRLKVKDLIINSYFETPNNSQILIYSVIII